MRFLLILFMTVFVIAKEDLKIDLQSPKRAFQDGIIYAKITITNTTDKNLNNIVVANDISDGIMYVFSTFPLNFTKNTNNEKVEWTISTLEKKSSADIVFQCRGLSEGIFTNNITIKHDEKTQEIKQEIKIEKLTKLKIFCERMEPFEVGKTGEYEIVVKNGGEGKLSKVKIDCYVPKNLKIVAPVKEATVSENYVLFILEEIPSKTIKTFQFKVTPIAKGEAKLRFRLQCEQFLTSKYLQKGIFSENKSTIK